MAELRKVSGEKGELKGTGHKLKSYLYFLADWAVLCCLDKYVVNLEFLVLV